MKFLKAISRVGGSDTDIEIPYSESDGGGSLPDWWTVDELADTVEITPSVTLAAGSFLHIIAPSGQGNENGQVFGTSYTEDGTLYQMKIGPYGNIDTDSSISCDRLYATSRLYVGNSSWYATAEGWEYLIGAVTPSDPSDNSDGHHVHWFDGTVGKPVMRFKNKDGAGTVTAGVTLGCSGEQTTVGSAGGASALPATPTKYLKVRDTNGDLWLLPAYAAA